MSAHSSVYNGDDDDDDDDADDEYSALVWAPECDIPVPGIFHFFGGIGTGIATNWYRKKVLEPVSEKFGTGKKSRNRYRKNLVLGKSLGTGIGQI